MNLITVLANKPLERRQRSFRFKLQRLTPGKNPCNHIVPQDSYSDSKARTDGTTPTRPPKGLEEDSTCLEDLMEETVEATLDNSLNLLSSSQLCCEPLNIATNLKCQFLQICLA